MTYKYISQSFLMQYTGRCCCCISDGVEGYVTSSVSQDYVHVRTQWTAINTCCILSELTFIHINDQRKHLGTA